MHGWEYGWVMMLAGGLLLLLFWGVLIGLVVWVVRTLTAPRGRDGASAAVTPHNSALEILQQRYARGEISREEYLAMRRDLES